MATIKDVARLAGVSMSTVSKYMNGGNVREENAKAIREAIAALDYRVNPFARSLKTQRSRAIGILKAGEYITVDRSGHITLTEKGIQTAENLYERHTILTSLLVSLGVEKETAAEDACKIEHVISRESFEAIKKYISANKE